MLTHLAIETLIPIGPLVVDMGREPPNEEVVSAPDICLNCGDNRAEEDSVTCATCDEQMFMGGYRGDGL
jgi:uncharacterized membrane protein